jgi:hypothetical protein
MLWIARLRGQRRKPGAAPTPRGYYAYLGAAWLFTMVWLVGVYWTATGSLSPWRWIAWIMLAIATPDLPTLFCTWSRYVELLERQSRPAERQWFTDVRTGDKE